MNTAQTPGTYHTKSRLYPAEELKPFFDLGDNQPPANSLRKPSEQAPAPVPLCLAWSESLLSPELTFSVDPEYLFSKYLWVTGTSQSAKNYSKEFYDRALQRISKDAPKTVIEIASNDGTFLLPFQDNSFQITGVDPAQNIAEEAVKNGIPTIAEFFSANFSEKYSHFKNSAGIIFARNVLPHVGDPRSVLQGIFNCLHSEGIGIVEFHHSSKILDELHYDSIYHEHIYYFSTHSVIKLLNECNLFAFDFEKSPISGGSAVLYFGKKDREKTFNLKSALQAEKESGILSIEKWQSFASDSKLHARKLYELTQQLCLEGKVIGYGSSARSSTMLNFAGISNQHLITIADKNEYKHGLITAGSNIHIMSPEQAMRHNPKSIVLLAWNFKDEIIRYISESFGFKGKVLIPLPKQPEIIAL